MFVRIVVVSLLVASSAVADSFTGFGSGVVACGDVNKDGVTDLLVASRDNRSPEAVWLLSGKDGSVLHIFRAPDDALGFGAFLNTVDDLDGDGLPEIAISTSGRRTIVTGWHTEHADPLPTCFAPESKGKPRCEILSSRTHSALFAWPACGRVRMLRRGGSDGHKDFLFLVPGRYANGTTELSVRSAKDGNAVLQFHPAADAPFENDAIAVGDVNGDGYDEVAVVLGGDRTVHAPPGVALLSGKDGAELWRDRGGGIDDYSWGTLRRTEDLDHDGIPDVLCGLESLCVRALSAKSGRLLFEIPAPYRNQIIDEFASTLDRIDDIDADGVADWVVGANEEWGWPAFDEGYVWLCSGKDGHRIRELAHDSVNGYDVCSLGDVDHDRNPDVALLIENAHQRWTADFDPIVRVVSTHDGHTIWEKDTKTLRAARDDLKVTPESAPLKPGETRPPR